MSSVTRMTGIALAAAAASMFMTVGVTSNAVAAEAKIHCEGVNSCKGKTDCKTASNECKGMNSCKGAGFIAMTAAECDQAKANMKKMEKK